VPEETNAAIDLTEAPPGEHDSQAPAPDDEPSTEAEREQAENAETSLDQPSS
jgi:hypothetical protein